MAYDVIVSGHLSADLLPETSHTPLNALASPGKIAEIGALEIATGGAVSNTGLALYQLGVDVGLMAFVGDDLLGQIIIERIKGYDTQLVDLIKIHPNIISAYTLVLSPKNVDRILLTCPGNTVHFGMDDIDFDLVHQAKIFHLGYPTLLPKLYQNNADMFLAIYQRIHDMGVITSLDMTLPDPDSVSGQVDWRQILARVLPYVDIFVPSLEEIVFMLHRDDYNQWQGQIQPNVNRAYLKSITDEILAMGVAISGVKLGEYGIYLRTTDDLHRLGHLQKVLDNHEAWRNQDIWHPTFDVKVVGTVGAGDSAYAGLLMALLHNMSPQAALKMMCAVGASSVEAASATKGIQSREETLARIASSWAVSSRTLPD